MFSVSASIKKQVRYGKNNTIILNPTLKLHVVIKSIKIFKGNAIATLLTSSKIKNINLTKKINFDDKTYLLAYDMSQSNAAKYLK